MIWILILEGGVRSVGGGGWGERRSKNEIKIRIRIKIEKRSKSKRKRKITTGTEHAHEYVGMAPAVISWENSHALGLKGQGSG